MRILDGAFLFLVGDEPEPLWRYDLATTSVSQLLDDVGDLGAPKSVDALGAVCVPEDEDVLHYVAFDTGAVHPTALASAPGHIRLSPTLVYFTTMSGSDTDLRRDVHAYAR